MAISHEKVMADLSPERRATIEARAQELLLEERLSKIEQRVLKLEIESMEDHIGHIETILEVLKDKPNGYHFDGESKQEMLDRNRDKLKKAKENLDGLWMQSKSAIPSEPITKDELDK